MRGGLLPAIYWLWGGVFPHLFSRSFGIGKGQRRLRRRRTLPRLLESEFNRPPEDHEVTQTETINTTALCSRIRIRLHSAVVLDMVPGRLTGLERHVRALVVGVARAARGEGGLSVEGHRVAVGADVERGAAAVAERDRHILAKGPRVHLGPYFEIDVASFEKDETSEVASEDKEENGDVATAVWAPPQPTLDRQHWDVRHGHRYRRRRRRWRGRGVGSVGFTAQAHV